MITFPNAKINLGLNIVNRRPDGYHNLETCFYPIAMCDALEFIPSDHTTLQIQGLPILGDMESNLVVRAFRMLQQGYHLPEIAMVLLKKIPMGAGLGGGSSDAAFMLKLLNTHFQLHLSDSELEIYASKLGADCAFFIQNKPVIAQGIGNEFTPTNLSLKGKTLVLVTPHIYVSTAEAYAGVTCNHWAVPLSDVLQKPLSEWREFLFNDFEQSVFRTHPRLATIKAMLYEQGAVYAAMSGSGSTLYGIFDHHVDVNFPDDKVFVNLLQ